MIREVPDEKQKRDFWQVLDKNKEYLTWLRRNVVSFETVKDNKRFEKLATEIAQAFDK